MGERYQITLGGFAEREVTNEWGASYVSLKGTGDLDRPVKIATADGASHHIWSVAVVVRNDRREDQNETLHALHESDAAPQLTLSWFCDPAKFAELTNPALARVAISFELVDASLVMSEQFSGWLLANVGYVAAERREVAPPSRNWNAKKADAAKYAMGMDTQLGRIAVELTTSRRATDAHGDPNDEAWEQDARLNSLFDSLHSARPAGVPPELRGTIDDVRARMKDIPPKEANDLAARHDSIWVSKPSLQAITGRRLDPAENGELEIWQVESAAESYLASGLTSPTFERLVVDSLLFAETAAFARELFRTAPPDVNPQGGTGKRFAAEAGWLLVTALVSLLADSQAGVAFWVVFCAITAVRWLRPKPTSTLADDENSRLFGLLNGMARTQGRMVADRPNPRLVRERLYDLERRGAVFSQYVYCMLDRWIAREYAASGPNDSNANAQ